MLAGVCVGSKVGYSSSLVDHFFEMDCLVDTSVASLIVRRVSSVASRARRGRVSSWSIAAVIFVLCRPAMS